MQLIQQQSFFMKKMMQLIQLHVFILGGPPGAPGHRPPQNGKKQKKQKRQKKTKKQKQKQKIIQNFLI